MQYDYKVQCPKCSELFVVDIDTTDIRITNNQYPCRCPSCGKKIKVRVMDDEELNKDIPPRDSVGGRRRFKSKSRYIQASHGSRGSKDDEDYYENDIDDDDGDDDDSDVEWELDDEDEVEDDLEHKHKHGPHLNKQRTLLPRGAPRLGPKSKEHDTSVESQKYDRGGAHISSGSLIRTGWGSGEAWEEMYDKNLPRSQRDKDKRTSADFGKKDRKGSAGRKAKDRARMDKPRRKRESRFLRKYRNPAKRLNLALILLILVFIFGLINGINSINHGSGQNIGGNLDKSETVDIHGRVIDFDTGRPIRDCIITISETGESTTTDSSGQYFIADVEVGEHEIAAEVNGYTNIIKKVTVDPELLGSVNFELKPGSGVDTMDESVELADADGEGNKMTIFTFLIIVFACFAILAIILIKQRFLFYLCVISVVLSLLSFGSGIGLILGLVALVLVLMSKSAFDKPDRIKSY